VNVFPVQRGDERAIEPAHYVVRDLVGVALQLLDGIRERRAPGLILLEELAQVSRRLHRKRGGRGEEIEELLVSRE